EVRGCGPLSRPDSDGGRTARAAENGGQLRRGSGYSGLPPGRPAGGRQPFSPARRTRARPARVLLGRLGGIQSSRVFRFAAQANLPGPAVFAGRDSRARGLRRSRTAGGTALAKARP